MTGPFSESLSRPMARGTYIRLGVVFCALKFLGDTVCYWWYSGCWLSVAQFLVPSVSLRSAVVPAAKLPGYYLVCTLWALPFLWVGVTYSLRRALDARVSPGWVLAFVVPPLNYVLIAVLALLPHQPGSEVAVCRASQRHAAAVEGVIATAAGICVALGLFLVMWLTAPQYGNALFLGYPTLIGATSSAVWCMRGGAVRTAWRVAFNAVACALLITLLFAMEGALCIAMAIPVAGLGGILGGMIGVAFAKNRTSSDTRLRVDWLATVGALAMVSAFDLDGEDGLFARTSETIVHASPSVVWRHLTAFSDIGDEPTGIFRTGIAYPLRARIEGVGVGAVRHCEFSTGAFVEPITVWDEPYRLAFTVTAQPDPMQETSFYRYVRPPHLDSAFRSNRGEFRLEQLGKNETRLIGTTWYRLHLAPVTYWALLTNYIVGEIHDRVLQHIKATAEADKR